MRCVCGVLIVLGALPLSAPGAVFQYSVPVATAKGQSTAFLWVPPKATYVRGVVIGGMTLMEREMARDPRIRRACDAEGLAIVFLRCGLLEADVQKVLDDLTYSTGDAEYRYTEIVGMMPRGFGGLKKGKAQTITFPPIGALKADSPPVRTAAPVTRTIRIEK